MSIWMKIALFFTRLIHKIKKAFGLAPAQPALPVDSGNDFCFNTIKRAEKLNSYEKYKQKSATLNEVVKLECAGKSALVKMSGGQVQVVESGIEPTVTVKFSEAGWATVTSGGDVQKLVMSGDLTFSGNIGGIMQNMGALKLLFLTVTGNLDTTK
jgi:hypothetical protein